jgi:hypothetical protein
VRALSYLAVAMLGAGIQFLFRAIPRVLGRRISQADDWLWGPTGKEAIGAAFFASLAHDQGLTLVADDKEAGLLADFGALQREAFDPARVDPRIRDFYEHTARYRLAVEAHWSPLFHPLGWLLVGAVSRRIAQLNFPLGEREAAQGVTSQIIRFCDPVTKETVLGGWLRTHAATGHPMYVGLYGIAHPPGEAGPCVRVVFPLPFGSSTVLLRPSVGEDASFHLNSNGWRFGQAGYYRIHDAAGVRRARYVLALREHFHLWVNSDGTVHTDHEVRFFRLLILRLRYALHHTN